MHMHATMLPCYHAAMLPCYHVHVVQVTTIHTSLEPAELTIQTVLKQVLEHKLHELPCLPPLSCQPVNSALAAVSQACHAALPRRPVLPT